VLARTSSLLFTVALLAAGCRAKDDAPIDIPLPADPQSAAQGATASGASRPTSTAAARPQEPRRPAAGSSSSADATDPAGSGAPTAKPKATGRPISTQL
jgi:hypothetical protein